MTYFTSSLKILTLTACCLSLSACITQEEKRGYAIEFAKLDTLQEGISTKEDVFNALGSPSTTSDFGHETWYYINTTLETSSLTKPNVIGQDTIEIAFDANGLVSMVKRNQGEAMRDIQFSDTITRTEGNSITVMEQLLGNLGKFNSPQGPANKVRGPNADGRE